MGQGREAGKRNNDTKIQSCLCVIAKRNTLHKLFLLLDVISTPETVQDIV